MCDRCGAGFTFFGLAEPQATLLDAYVAALRAGWKPEHAVTVVDPTTVGMREPATHLDYRDTIENSGSDDGSAVVQHVHLTRWLWDGEFCGEAHMTFDVSAAEPERLNIVTSIVPWKDGLGYPVKAARHLLLEASELGIPAADIDRAAARFAPREG